MSEKLINLQQGEALANAVLTKVKNKSYAVSADIAPVETSPATAAHAVDSYIMYDGELYKVTTAIAIGDTLSTSTNIEKTTVTDEIGDAATLNAEDITNNKTYAMQFQLYQGKPRIAYDEI